MASVEPWSSLGRVLAPGSVIQSVTRESPWVVIVTNNGEIHFAGARMAVELECPKCREHRLVEIIETAKKQIGFCKVCGKPFPLKG